MTSTYWHKQTSDKPLFESLLWSRPQNRRTAGKLLIIGGNSHGFAAPAEAYRAAEAAGIGSSRVVLPSAVAKIVKALLEQADFATSTPSGSFAAAALGELRLQAGWADGVLLAGDFGRNSETAILLEKFVGEYSGRLTLTQDALDYFKNTPKQVIDRRETTIVGSFAQLQKLAAGSGFSTAFTFGMGLVQLVDALRDFTTLHPCNIVVKYLTNITVASQGQVSTTPLNEDMEVWRVKTAAAGATWWLQNPGKPFESLTTSIYSLFDNTSNY